MFFGMHPDANALKVAQRHSILLIPGYFKQNKLHSYHGYLKSKGYSAILFRLQLFIDHNVLRKSSSFKALVKLSER